MKLPAHARRLAIFAGLGITLLVGSAQVRADEPQVNPDETLRRVTESLEAADVPPEMRGRILDLIRSRQAAKQNAGPDAEGDAGGESRAAEERAQRRLVELLDDRIRNSAPRAAEERAQRPDSLNRDPQAAREQRARVRQQFWERVEQAKREAEEARARAERLQAEAERATAQEDQADRGADPFGGEDLADRGSDPFGGDAERRGRPGGPGMDPFWLPRQAAGFEIGVVFDLRKGGQMVVAEVADGSAAEVGGVRRGDQVLRADGEELNSPEQLAAAVQRAGAEQRPLELVIRRGEEEVELQVRPTLRPRYNAPWSTPPGVGPWSGMPPSQQPHGPQSHGSQAHGQQPHGPQAHSPQTPGNVPRRGMTPPQGTPPHGGPGGRMGGGMGGMMGGDMGDMGGGMMGGGMPWQRDLDGLRQEVESLRKELRELRELLEQPKNPPVAEPTVLSF